MAVAVDTQWEFLPDLEQERVELVQTNSVTTLTGEVLMEEGVTGTEEQTEVQEAALADLLIKDFVLPFEAVSVLLLAALIGALVLVRPDSRRRRG